MLFPPKLPPGFPPPELLRPAEVGFERQLWPACGSRPSKAQDTQAEAQSLTSVASSWDHRAFSTQQSAFDQNRFDAHLVADECCSI